MQYQKLYIKQGKGRAARAKCLRKYLRTKKVNEGGRSRKFGKANKKAFLAKKAQIQKAIDNANIWTAGCNANSKSTSFLSCQG